VEQEGTFALLAAENGALAHREAFSSKNQAILLPFQPLASGNLCVI
jgi:hypothetical protein